VKRGGRAQIIDACIARSILWDRIKKFRLTINMRIRNAYISDPVGAKDVESFRHFLDAIGDGLASCPEFPDSNVIRIPDEMVAHSHTPDEFIDEIFPDLANRWQDTEWLCERAIVTPKNIGVDRVNASVPELHFSRNHFELTSN